MSTRASPMTRTSCTPPPCVAWPTATAQRRRVPDTLIDGRASGADFDGPATSPWPAARPRLAAAGVVASPWSGDPDRERRPATPIAQHQLARHAALAGRD